MIDVHHGQWFPTLLVVDQPLHDGGGEGDARIKRQAGQRSLDQILAVCRRQVQDFQVFLGRRPRARTGAQFVVRQAEASRREQFLAVAVIREGARLSPQRFDHVPIVDRRLMSTAEARQRVHELRAEIQLQLRFAQHHPQRLPDQAAVDRIRVGPHLDRAAAGDCGRERHGSVEARGRQRTQTRQLRVARRLPREIAPRAHALQKQVVLFPRSEVATAAQAELLVQRRLEVAVRRFDIAVLMGATHVDPLAFHAVVGEQRLIPPAKLPRTAEVVDGRRETVAANAFGHAAPLVKSGLQPGRQGLERLAEADPHRLDVGVRQDAVEQQVRKGRLLNSDAERSDLGEVEARQATRPMDLVEEHVPRGARRRPPLIYAPFERATVALLKPLGMLAHQLPKQRDRLQLRIGFESRLHLRPDVREHIRSRPPAPRPPRRRNRPRFSITPRRLLVHAAPPGRFPQRATLAQPTPQRTHLTILDHGTSSLSSGSRPFCPFRPRAGSSNCRSRRPPARRSPGILVVARREK